jgi:hypothetical protein
MSNNHQPATAKSRIDIDVITPPQSGEANRGLFMKVRKIFKEAVGESSWVNTRLDNVTEQFSPVRVIVCGYQENREPVVKALLETADQYFPGRPVEMSFVKHADHQVFRSVLVM